MRELGAILLGLIGLCCIGCSALFIHEQKEGWGWMLFVGVVAAACIFELTKGRRS